MRILITGATGLIGRRLVDDRLERGDEVVALSRSRGRAASRLGARGGLEIVEGDPGVPGDWQRAVDGTDAVVHLAGAGIFDRRWNDAYRRELADSRVDSTHQVVEAIREAARRPRVFLSGSAIGIYVAGGDRELDERAPKAEGDFLGDLAIAWEAAAAPARDLGVRTVRLRTGLVLDPEGGLLGKLRPIFALALGGPIGTGGAWMPWIHWRDWVGLADHALRTPDVDDAINLVAPHPVRNRDFTRALGRALDRPALLPVPTPALRVALGPAAKYAAASQRVIPTVALETGYAFRYPEVGPALEDLVGDDAPDPAAAGPADSIVRGATSSIGAAAPAGATLAAAAVPREGGAARREAEAPWRELLRDGAPTVPIRLVAAGVDGGVVRPGGRIREGLVHAWRDAARGGRLLVLASARNPRGLESVAQALEHEGPVIACNGAVTWDPAGRRAIHHEALAAALAVDVVARARAAAPGCLVGIERLDEWYTDRVDRRRLPDGAAVEPDAVGPLEVHLGEPVTQLVFLGDEGEIARVRSALEEDWRARRIAIFDAGGRVLLVTSPRADRGVALHRIASAAGIPREATMAIGADAHDLGLVDRAGFGVALASAPARVRDVADAVVPPASEGGVARAIGRWVLAPRPDPTDA